MLFFITYMKIKKKKINLDLEKKQYFILEKQNLRIYKKQSKSKINVWGLNGQMKLIKKNY